jgi:beta-glucosidase/6-phospho-beta-glucosidase/beta-galactosidase
LNRIISALHNLLWTDAAWNNSGWEFEPQECRSLLTKYVTKYSTKLYIYKNICDSLRKFNTKASVGELRDILIRIRIQIRIPFFSSVAHKTPA